MSSISDSDRHADAAYKYLGLGTDRRGRLSPADVKLTISTRPDNVTGLDRFGRVVDQMWKRLRRHAHPLDEYTYTYDRAGNRTARTNALETARSTRTISYDALNRLTEWQVERHRRSRRGRSTPWATTLRAGTYNAANEETPTGSGVPATTPPAT